MSIVWKLLRQHISLPQFAGFSLANLFGMLIVLLGYQFYSDVLPVFTQGDSFMGSDYLIVSKKISIGSTLGGNSTQFTESEIGDIASQPFTKKAARFTSTEYKVDAHMGIDGVQVLSSEIFFESVPDGFLDVTLEQWKWSEGDTTVPIVLPRSYINMYNFGFAQTHSLPKISDGLMGMIDFRISIHGNGKQGEYKGKVIGLSNRLNSILVPQAFMDWSNKTYAPEETSLPSRLIVEVDNPTDERIAHYISDCGYEVEDNKLQAEKTTYFLRVVVMLVMSVGLIISLLSFYILMLSIYLLVQKNTSKLENLMLIGYSPSQVARPYQLLTLALNVLVLAIVLAAVSLLRGEYMDMLQTLYPNIDDGSLLPAVTLGLVLLAAVTLANTAAVRRKVTAIWKQGRVAAVALFVVLTLPTNLSAESKTTVGEVFATMPDSLMPYLSKNNRLDLIDFAKAGMKSEVNNVFDGSTELLKLTDNYMKLQLNSQTTVEMRLIKADSLLADSADYVLYVVKTCRTSDAGHSEVRKFTSKWMPLSLSLSLKDRVGEMMMRKQDTTEEEWQKAVAAIDNADVTAELSPDSDILSLSLTFSLLTADDKKIISDKITLTTLKINL